MGGFGFKLEYDLGEFFKDREDFLRIIGLRVQGQGIGQLTGTDSHIFSRPGDFKQFLFHVMDIGEKDRFHGFQVGLEDAVGAAKRTPGMEV